MNPNTVDQSTTNNYFDAEACLEAEVGFIHKNSPPSALYTLEMYHPPKRVAVIGAGISGIVAAAHLSREGINVTVFERSNATGGIWQVTCFASNSNKLIVEKAV
jgi:NADPH-dependent glutamate synthase beta subunit-like oxidoreductase